MTAQQVVDAYREARETLEADPQYGRAALPEHWTKFDDLEAEALCNLLTLRAERLARDGGVA